VTINAVGMVFPQALQVAANATLFSAEYELGIACSSLREHIGEAPE
jgi:hypothetical protein